MEQIAEHKKIILFYDIPREGDPYTEIEKIFQAGSHGIILTNNFIPCEDLLLFYKDLRLKYPDKWLGLQFKDVLAHEIFEIFPMDADAFWIGTVDYFNGQVEIPNSSNIFDLKLVKKWKGKIFAGLKMLSFEDQEKFVYNLKIVRNFVDVVALRPLNNPDRTLSFLKQSASEIKQENLGLEVDNMTDKKYYHCLPYVNYIILSNTFRPFTSINTEVLKDFIRKVNKYTEDFFVRKTKI